MANDLDRVRSNISTMIAKGAPDEDISRYLSYEGISADQLRGGGQQQASGSVMSDIARTIPAGLARGAAALVGLPGDVAEFGAKGIDMATQFVGGGPRPSGPPMAGFSLPDSGDVTRAVEGVTGPLYKPQTTPGKYVNTVAEFAPNMISPGTMARRAMGGVFAPGIASEAAGQYAEGSRAEPLARIAGALVGGVAGTAGAAAVESRRSLMPGMSGAASRELERVIPPGAQQRVAEYGPEAMVLDASPDALATAQGVAVRGARDQLVNALETRQRGANTRLANEMDETLGPAVAPSAIEGSLANQRAGLGELYGQVAEAAGPVDLRPLYSQLLADLPEQVGTPRRVLENVIEMVAPNAQGQRRIRTTAREALNIRQAIDDEIARLADQPNAQRLLTQSRQLVNNALEESAPDIRILDATYSNLSNTSGALERGRNVLTNERTAIRPEDLIAERAAMSLPEREAMRMGTRAELDRIVGTKANDITALRLAVRSEGDWNPAKLAEIFGAAETRRIMGAVDREAAFQDAYTKIIHNSQTANRMEAANRIAAQETPSMSGATIPGMAIEGVRKGVRSVTDALMQGRKANLDNELAGALVRQGSSRDDLLAAIVEAQKKRKKGGSATRDMLLRVLQGAQSGSVPTRTREQ